LRKQTPPKLGRLGVLFKLWLLKEMGKRKSPPRNIFSAGLWCKRITRRKSLGRETTIATTTFCLFQNGRENVMLIVEGLLLSVSNMHD